MKKILFSVVSHDQQELVQKFINSLDKHIQSKGFIINIIVTENFATDNKVRSEIFSLIKVKNLREKGFGANHNSAFEKLESDYIFVINPDIELIETLDMGRVIKSIERRRLDISSPTIVNRMGEIEDYKRANLSLINLIKRKLLKKKQEQFDWFAGMFLVIKSASFRKLKGFDTDFFMYVEDCDLCMRAKNEEMRLGDIENFSVLHYAERASMKNFRHFKWHVSSLIQYWLFKKK